jgi:hypothetical protein
LIKLYNCKLPNPVFGKGVSSGYSFTGFGKNVKNERKNARAVQLLPLPGFSIRLVKMSLPLFGVPFEGTNVFKAEIDF